MCYCQMDGVAQSLKLVQSLGLPEIILRPASLALVQSINNDAEDIGVKPLAAPS